MTSRPTFQPLLNRLPLQHRRPLSHGALRPISRTSHPPNSYTDSTTANVNNVFASGTLFPPTFVGQISRWPRLVVIPLPLTPSPQHLPPTRTSSRRSNWTTVNVPYVRSKSRCLQGLSRFNRAPKDLIQFSPNRQTPFWTPISQPVLFSTPHRRGRAPLCASRRNRMASESQSTTKN